MTSEQAFQGERAALGGAEANYRAIFDALSDAILIHDAGTGDILEVNQRMGDMFGYSLEEARHLNLVDLCADDPRCTRDTCRRLLRKAAQGDPQLFEWQAQDSAGLRFWIEGHLRHAVIGGQDRVVAIIRDITARKLTQQALRESEACYRMITEESLAGVYIINESGFIYVNGRMAHIFGYRPEEIIRRLVKPQHLVHPDDLELVRENIRQRLSGGLDSAHYTFRGLRQDGTVIHCESLGRRVEFQGRPAILGTLLDITAPRQAEEALRAQKNLLNTIFSVTPDLLVLKDRHSVYQAVNPAFCQFLGLPEADILGKTDFVLFPGPEAGVYRRDDARVFETGKPLIQDEERIGAEGKKWFQTIKSPILDENGASMGIFCSMRDITRSKQAEEALKEANNNLRALIQASPLAIMAIDLEGKVTSWNPAAERLFGWLQDETIGRPNPIIPRGKEEEFRELCQRVLAGESLTGIELRRQKRDGSQVDISLSTAPLCDAAGNIVGAMGLIEDITARKQSEEALRQSEARFRAVFEGAAIGMAQVDLKRGILEINQALKEMAGYSPAEMRSLSAHELTHPDDLAADKELFAELVAGKRNCYQLEKRYRHKDGRWIWTRLSASLVRDTTGEPLFAISMVEDITERKLAEEALREREERYRQLVETMNEAMGLGDQNYCFTYVNNRFIEIFGYSPEELLGHPVLEFIHEDYREFMQEQIARRKRGEVARYEIAWRAKDGQKIYTLVSPGILYNGDGSFAGALGVLTDITERKQAEEALQLSERKLRILSSQLLTVQERERRRLSRELHDELGQALTVLKFHLVAIENKLRPDQQELQRDCEHLLCRIDEIIENVRRLSWDLSPTILEDLGLSSSLVYLIQEICQNNDIQCSIEMDKIDHLFSSEAQINIYRLFQESLNNISKHARATRVSAVVRKYEDRVAFMVQDNGQGFVVEKAFNRNVSEKRLGLTTMNERARMVGGSLEIWSQKNQGTRITFTIPIDHAGN